MVLTKAQAKSLSILEVARSLGMEMKRNSHKEYYWAEHDSFKIDTHKNTWHWYSRGTYGDTINLVQEMRQVNYSAAMKFLETGQFPEAKPMEEIRQPFRYTLEPYERPFKEARIYLKETRGLSDETINFFLGKGVLAQARRKDRDGFLEDVLVFKYLDKTQNIVGASLQGLVPYPDRHEGKGYLKQIMYRSEGVAGLNVSIGSPERLIVAEAPIDLMSYYELHKDELENVRLVAMEGLKEGVLSRYAMEALQERGVLNPISLDYTKSKDLTRVSNFLSDIAHLTKLFKSDKYQDLITLAVDQDKAGSDFMIGLQDKKIPVIDARPPKGDSQEKMDWNEYLQIHKIHKKATAVESPEAMLNQREQLKIFFEKEIDKVTIDSNGNYRLGSLIFQHQNPDYPLSKEEQLSSLIDTIILNYGEPVNSFRPNGPVIDLEYLQTAFGYRPTGAAAIFEQHKKNEKKAENSRLTEGVNQSFDKENFIKGLELMQKYSVEEVLSRPPIYQGDDQRLEALQIDLEGFDYKPLDDFIRQYIDPNYDLDYEEDAWNNFFKNGAGKDLTVDSFITLAKNNGLVDEVPVIEPWQALTVLEPIRDVKKAPDQSQEPSGNAGDSHRNPDSLGDLSPGAASKPVADEPQPDFPVIAPLQFTTKGEWLSTLKPGYHVITDGELKRLNKFAPGLQATAQWYLKELSGSTITYLYQDRDGIGKLELQFSDDNFAHLTGISPKETEMRQVVYDFATGKGDYGNIQVSHAIKDKSMVLPLLPDILSSQAFVFNDLSEVEKFNKIDLSQAIKTDDEDLLLAIRDIDGVGIPASVMRIKEKLSLELEGKEKVVLGIYRDRKGNLEQLSLNNDYIKDGGRGLLGILQSREDYFGEERASITQEAQAERDSDADGISDEEERKQGTNPHDFRSKPGSKPLEETSLEPEEIVAASGGLTVAEFINNKDVAGLNRHLKEGIKAYLDSDKYKNYLTKMSQLNNYSSRNLRLLLAQNPEATQVASFKQWKETFGRYVKKGEKSLRIFAPMTKVKKDRNNQPILDKNGKPETVTFFGLVPVFDVSQTDGKEMPKAASEVKEQLTDVDYANLYRALMGLAKENNVSVRFEEMTDDRKGYYDVAEHQIVLRSNDMNKSQIIKTFLHETAHSELHHANHPQKEQLTRSTAELQAESVAYVVASYYGMDTSDYSFAYLANWSDDKATLADLEAQLDIVQQEAKSLMVRMDQQLEQLRLVQEKQAKHQFEQKLQKFKDQSKEAIAEHQQEQKAEARSKKEKGFSK